MNKAVSFNLGVGVALVESIEEMVKRIKKKVDQTPPGELVYTTSGWLPQQFKENRVPTRYDLDPVFESVDMLRVLEHGLPLKLVFTERETIGVDTPADLARAEKALSRDPTTRLYLT